MFLYPGSPSNTLLIYFDGKTKKLTQIPFASAHVVRNHEVFLEFPKNVSELLYRIVEKQLNNLSLMEE